MLIQYGTSYILCQKEKFKNGYIETAIVRESVISGFSFGHKIWGRQYLGSKEVDDVGHKGENSERMDEAEIPPS